ncbi:MAG: thiamine pyrophosphate-binding protein [Gemmatimonadetes bacterium]|jgi:acetolactate synthase-1/2/3 large subunit|nr:thiamine pyrophosphate-binding protein [Gemmatimonadota bacterium]
MANDRASYFSLLTQPTVAQLVLRYLELEGVDRLFGIPGAAVMHLLEELRLQRDSFEYIICRHETGAAYIADGYSRVSGKLGVVLVTSGPGATNAVTGTMNAQNSGTALLTITGEIPEAYFGLGYLQEGIDASLNIDAIYGSSSRYSSVVTSPSNFQTLFTQALRDALSLPRQAVHISLPDDVAAAQLDLVRFPTSSHNYRTVPQGADPQRVQRAFEALIQAERPLVFLGNGARGPLAQRASLEMFTAWVEKFTIAVMTTPDAKGIFPERHPLSLRNYGMAACEWAQCYMDPQRLDPSLPPGYDALLVVGSTLGGLATNKWDPLLLPTGSFMQLDVDPSVIGRAFPIELGIVAEAGTAVEYLHALGERTDPNAAAVSARRELIARLKQEMSPFVDPAARDSDATPIRPAALMRILNQALPPESDIFVDAGNCVGWCLHYLEIDPPTRIHSSLAMGPMGFGVGAVIGGKLAAPQRTCIAVVGDGAFLMHGSEVSTAAQYGVGAIWVVLCDNDLLMVSQGMNYFFPDPTNPDVWSDYYKLGSPDLAKFALGLGADVYNVGTPGEAERMIRQAITAANADRKPQVIVAHIDTRDVPPYYPPKAAPKAPPPGNDPPAGTPPAGS